MYKKPDARAKFCFANLNLLLSIHSVCCRWQIDNGSFNRPIMARTQILVHRWRPRTGISAQFLHKLISVCGAGSLILGNEFTFRSNRSSAAASTLSTSGAMGLSEKTFLNPKKMTASKEVRDEKGPSLDDFDKEIEIYQVCLNPISTLSQSR